MFYFFLFGLKKSWLTFIIYNLSFLFYWQYALSIQSEIGLKGDIYPCIEGYERARDAGCTFLRSSTHLAKLDCGLQRSKHRPDYPTFDCLQRSRLDHQERNLWSDDKVDCVLTISKQSWRTWRSCTQLYQSVFFKSQYTAWRDASVILSSNGHFIVSEWHSVYGWKCCSSATWRVWSWRKQWGSKLLQRSGRLVSVAANEVHESSPDGDRRSATAILEATQLRWSGTPEIAVNCSSWSWERKASKPI